MHLELFRQRSQPREESVPNRVENEWANSGNREGATVLFEQTEPFDMAASSGCRKDPPLSRAALGMPTSLERGSNL